MKKSFMIGVAGPTGSGKSTLAFGLQDRFPDQVTIVHLDDYFKKENVVPIYRGERNWDDPRSIRIKDLVSDLKSLKQGKTVNIYTKSPRLNPEYAVTEERIYVEHEARPLIVVEGFLGLYYPQLRKLFDIGIYLAADVRETVKRRVHFMWDFYRENVLEPMHEKYVAPTATHADLVLDVGKMSQHQVLEKVIELIPENFVLKS